MRLSAEERRSQIMDKALGLFARYGFEGTTTRRIADHAGVTEAVIFRHFESKEELYWQVISERCMGTDNLERVREVLASDVSDLEKFTAMAEDRLVRNERNPARIRLLLFSALENHRLTERFFSTFVAEHYELLTGYIRQRIREGKFQPVDPTLAARNFLGMVFYHVMVQDLFAGKQQQRIPIAEAARQIAILWLAGISTDSWQNLAAHLDAHHSVNDVRSGKGRDSAHNGHGSNGNGTAAAKTAGAGKEHVQA